MKTIALLGGMSFESSLEYYRLINEEINKRLGKAHSAKLLMYSFDFQIMKENMENDDWASIKADLIGQSVNLRNAGADFIVICTNTMHMMAGDIEEATGLDVLHIADVTGKAINKRKLKKVLLLGTNFTMEGNFYKDVIKNNYDIDILIPSHEDRKIVHNIIFNELVKGIITNDSKEKYIEIIRKSHDAEGVILGCTEIPLLIKDNDIDIPIFDTTLIHSIASVDKALED